MIVHSIKESAIALRRKGLSYSEILREIPVAKSTLSIWLRSVGLARAQKQMLTKKKLDGMRRGWEAIHNRRLEKTKTIKDAARIEAVSRVHDALWLAGVLLYWCEGSKEKPWRTGKGVAFTNMDPVMLFIMRNWFKRYLSVTEEGIVYCCYAHHGSDIDKIRIFWAHHFDIPENRIRMYFKPDAGKGYRKNTGVEYNGVFRLELLKSIDLNRKIAGWVEGVVPFVS